LRVSPRKKAGLIARYTSIRTTPTRRAPEPVRNTPPICQWGEKGRAQNVLPKLFFQNWDAVVGGGSLMEAQVRVALAYYQRFGEEIDPQIERDRRGLDELMADYPTIEVLQA
jgi:hypothetical protein